MRAPGFLLPLVAALAVSACSSNVVVSAPTDISSRAGTVLTDIAAQPTGTDVKVVDFVLAIPQGMRVSESASFYPMFTDIVWRGDPIGDRAAQVSALFEEAADRAIATDGGSRDVVAVATLERFHGLTERARYVTGGVYNIRFQLAFQDAVTGEPVGQSRLVVANLPAPGGQAAIQLEQEGQTEKVRVTDFLAYRLGQEFAVPLAPGA